MRNWPLSKFKFVIEAAIKGEGSILQMKFSGKIIICSSEKQQAQYNLSDIKWYWDKPTSQLKNCFFLAHVY